jgi:hypothetical protein
MTGMINVKNVMLISHLWYVLRLLQWGPRFAKKLACRKGYGHRFLFRDNVQSVFVTRSRLSDTANKRSEFHEAGRFLGGHIRTPSTSSTTYGGQADSNSISLLSRI